MFAPQLATTSVAPDLVIQIVNYKTLEHLEICLQTVVTELEKCRLSVHVMVLDNNSGDDLSVLQTKYEGLVDFFNSETNLGFGGGHNALAHEAESLAICFVNPDVKLIEPGIFDLLFDELSDPQIAAVGPLLLESDGKPQRWDHGEKRGLRAMVANRAGHAHWRPRFNKVDVAWVSGAFLMVRRSAFEDMEGFDEDFFLYKEEEDLCLRLRKDGWRIVYQPTVRAQHIGAVVAGRSEHLVKSVEIFRKKHTGGRFQPFFDWLYRNVTRRI